MKYFYLFVLSVCISSVKGQEAGHKIPFIPRYKQQQVISNPQARTTAACTADTIRYPYRKEMMLSAGNDSFFVDAMVSNVRTASQAYTTNQEILVKGVQFWGGAYTIGQIPKNVPVVVSLWSVNAQRMPVAELTSTVINVTDTYTFYSAMFAAPVSVNTDYAVTVRASVSSDTLAVTINNAGTAWTPYGESLAWRRYGSGAWNSTATFFGQDVDYMIFPIVEYGSISADFTTDGAATTTQTEIFTNTSYAASPILQHRMYNLHAFNHHFGLSLIDSTFAWAYGDGYSDIVNTGVHLYATPGNRMVELTAQMKGYFSLCTETKSLPITVSGVPAVIDTIRYPHHKEMVLSAGPDSFFIDAMVGNVRTVSQAYTANQQLFIKGVQFWGGAYTIHQIPKNVPVVVSVWSVDAQHMPVTELASTTISVTENYTFYTAMFPSPVMVNTDYAVTARASLSSDTLGVTMNNAGTAWTPYGESLAWRRFGSGIWNSSASFFGQDVDYMVFPIVQYTIAPSFTTDNTATAGTPETFSNTSSPLLQDRMYNLHVFDEYFGIAAADSTFTWHYGDGTSSVQYDGIHTYANAGNRTVKLVSKLNGYFTNHSDSFSIDVNVLSALPVTLGQFTGRSEANGNLLQWHAIAETHVDHYMIERSTDGIQFVPIASVAAQNSDNVRYSYTDYGAGIISYYRLKVVDQDGRFDYSRTIKVTKDQEQFIVKALHAGNAIQLQIISAWAGKVDIAVHNAAGALLSQTNHQIQSGNNNVYLRALQGVSGIYYITVSNGKVATTVRVAQHPQ